MIRTLARMRLKIMGGGVALLALAAALLLAAQPAEAQNAVPGQVTITQADRHPDDTGKIRVTWTAVTATPAVKRYEYRLDKDSAGYPDTWTRIPSSASLTTYDITVTEAGSYTIEMRAVNSVGNGEAGSTSVLRRIFVPTVPGRIAPIGITKGQPGEIVLSWRVIGAYPGASGGSPTDWDGDSPITRYEYTWKRGSGDYQTTWRCITPGSEEGATQVSHTVVGLAAGAYTFKMRAVNAIGNGAESADSISLTIEGAPQGTTEPNTCPAAPARPSGGNTGNGNAPAAAATPDPKASMTIKFRNDSDGIVRPGQDVELVVETTDVSTSQTTKVTKVTLQGLNLYAKVVTGEGATATTALTLLGSQAGAKPFPGEDSITLTQALKPTAHATGSGATKKTYTIEISVPAGTPDGEYVVTASGNDGKSTDPGALSAPNAKLTVSSTLAGVSTVTFAPSAPRRTKTATETDASPAGGDGYADDASLSESTTIAAGTGSVEFTLSILNAANQAAEADDVNSIFITTTGGTLTTKYELMTGANKADTTDRNMTANCPDPRATCQIDLSKLKGGKLLPKGIRVLLNAPATPGTATVRATVVAGGKVHQPEPVTVTFTGPAKSLSIDEPPSTVLGYDVVGKDKDGNDVADDVTKTGHKPETGAASRDELAFMVQATDGAAGAGNVVTTPTLTVMVHDSAGALIAKGKYQTKQSGALMNMLLLDIDAPKATALKPGEYKLTLSSATPALKAERMFRVVGDGSTLELELAPMSADTFGQTVTATATVQDEAGNPVAAGTAVTFKVSDFSGGNDAVAVLDTEGAVLTNKDGAASAVLTVVGAGNAVVRATTDKAGGGSLLKTAVLVSRAGAPAAEGEAGLDCLSELSGFAVWTCGGSTASALFELLSARGATAIHLWNGSVWIRYSVVDGTMVPGSRDFTVGESDIIYISY